MTQAGVTVETVDAGRVRLRSETDENVFRLHVLKRAATDAALNSLGSGNILLAVPKASDRTIAKVVQQGWGIVTDTGFVSIPFGADRYERSADIGTALLSGPDKPGPSPWATYTVTRRLLAIEPATQLVLSESTGVSQSRLSRVLNRLRDTGLVQRQAGGWRAADWGTLFQWWITTYPGPEGVASYWYSLDDPTTQTRNALSALASTPGNRAVVSGDVAADQIAPWRRPERATLYARAGVSLTAAGFIPVGSPAESTLTLCAPIDPGVWLPQPWVSHGFPLADPLQIAYDIVSSSAPDAAEAVSQLQAALRTQLAQTWRAAIRSQP